MNELSDFHLELYYTKLEYLHVNSINIQGVWDELTEKNINAISHLYYSTKEAELYILTAKKHFGNKIGYPEIIETFKLCCKNLNDYPNKTAFTNSFFNRLKLRE